VDEAKTCADQGDERRPAGRTGRRPATAPVVPLRPADDDVAAAREALAAVHRHLDRCKLLASTVKAYKRQTTAYVAWLAGHADHGDAFADLVGAEGAVTAWRRHMITARSSPSKVNQALAAVTLMYEQADIRIAVKRVRIPRPGEPDALIPGEEGAVRRAALRRGPRDAAIIAVLLDAGARVEECARLDAGDFAITARTGDVRLHGKGDEVRSVPLSRRARGLVSAWLDVRGRHPGPVWTGQRGPLTISGITQVVLAVGADAGIPGLRPHRCRHTFATRLRQGGADPAQVQALLGHASIDTAARYFRAGSAENAAVIERIFGE
jgi:integrase